MLVDRDLVMTYPNEAMPKLTHSHLVEAAMNLAQSGRVEDAQKLVVNIRADGGFLSNSDVSIEIIVIEGICSLYSGDLAHAHDRFARATAIATVYGSEDLRSLALCWAAVCQISRGRHVDAARSAVAANRYAESCRPEVRFRVALVISMLLEYSGSRSESLVWFDSARRSLESIRKAELMVVAIYNLAMVRLGSELVAQLRSGNLHFGNKSARDLLFVRSAENYAEYSASKIRFELHDLCSAYALALTGDCEAALRRCAAFLDASSPVAPVDKARAKFCMAFCQFVLSANVDDVSGLRGFLVDLADNDDLAIAHDTLSHIYRSRKDLDYSEFHRSESKRYLGLFDETAKAVRDVFLDAGII